VVLGTSRWGAAVEDRLLVVNSAVGKRILPALERRKQKVLSRAQVNTLIEGTRDDPWHALWVVALTTGMRPGELLGVQRRDVSFEWAEVSVQRSLVRPTHRAAWVLEAPKTGRRRSLPLLGVALAALRVQRDWPEADRLAAGERHAGQGFVFADAHGEPLRADGVYKYHWLRHSRGWAFRRCACTTRSTRRRRCCFRRAWPMKVVQELLGHASMTLTADTYSHVTPAFKREAVDALESYLAGRAP